MKNFIKKYLFKIISLIICLTFFLIYSNQSLKLYQAHRTRGDLTNFAQAMWNSTQGRLMQNTFNYSVHNFWSNELGSIPINSNILGIHFNPILFTFIPFYLISPNPETLIIIQSFLVTFSGYIIFLLSLHLLKNKTLSFLIQISFLSYFPLVSAVLSEFHAYTLSIFFGSLLIYFSFRKKNLLYIMSLFLFLFVQENTGIASLFFGLYLMIRKNTRKKGLITAIISLTYFYLSLKVIIPSLSNYGYYLFENAYGSPLGNNINEIAINSITKPFLLIKTILSPENIKYLSKLILPISPLIFLSPITFIFSLSGLASNLLSQASILKAQLMHYESLAIPFLYFSLILGVKRLINQPKPKRKKLYTRASIFIILVSFLFGFYKFTLVRINQPVIYEQSNKDLDTLVSLVPENRSISTQDYISGHLTNRQELYLFPVCFEKADYVLVSTKRSWPLSSEDNNYYLNKLLNNKNRKVTKAGDFVLIEKIKNDL